MERRKRSAPSPFARLIGVPLLCALGAVLFFARPAHAGDSCTTAANVSSKVWQETPPAVKTAIASAGPWGATAMKTLKFLDDGIKIWNKIAGDSWAKVGKRRLDFDGWSKGTLIGSTERMFVSPIPAVNPVKIDFHKTDHGGKVKVVICKIPKKGKPKVVKSFFVEPDATPGLIKSVQIDDAKGHVISVVLHGKSFSNKLGYKFRAKMIYEDDPEAKTVKAPRGSGTTYTSEREDGSVSAPR